MPMVVILALFIYLSKDLVVTILFTNEFQDSKRLFLFQLCGDVLKIGSWLYAYPMLSRGATKWFVCSEILFSFVFVGLSYLFVSWLGASGVPIAYLANYAIYFVFVVSNINRFAR